MKKLVLITGVILISCVLIGSLAAPGASASGASVSEPGTEAPEKATSAAGYVIGDSGGKVAVFAPGDDVPLLVTDTLTDSLPRADAKRIRAGISVPDEKVLKKLLEDLCS